jgi:hypothetical protein
MQRLREHGGPDSIAIWTLSENHHSWNQRDAKRFCGLVTQDARLELVYQAVLGGCPAIRRHLADRCPRCAAHARHATHVRALHSMAPGVVVVDAECRHFGKWLGRRRGARRLAEVRRLLSDAADLCRVGDPLDARTSSSVSSDTHGQEARMNRFGTMNETSFSYQRCVLAALNRDTSLSRRRQWCDMAD